MLRLIFISIVSAFTTETNMVWIDTNKSESDFGEILNINKFDSKFPWLRPKKAFYEVDVGLDFNNHTNTDFDGRYISAFGFIDNDKYNDIVVLNEQRNSFAVYFFDNNVKEFIKYPMTLVDSQN